MSATPGWARGVAALAVSALLLTACSTAVQDPNREITAADPLTLVLAVETNPPDPLAEMLNLFGDAVARELGDRVEIERHLGGAIGDETATLEALRAGQVDVVVLGSDISSVDPIFGVLEMPFLFSDRETVSGFLDGEFGREMSDSFAASAGLRVLSYGENGFRHVTNNRGPIEGPEDLVGVKLRVPEVPARVRTFEQFGAVPTPMGIDEVYLALDQGVLDGQENPLQVIDAFSFDETQRYLSLTGHVYSPAYLTINLDTWNSIPAEVQPALQRAADEAAARSRAKGQEVDGSLVKKFEAAGMSVNQVDVARFRSGAAAVWDELKRELPGDFGDRVLAAYGEQ